MIQQVKGIILQYILKKKKNIPREEFFDKGIEPRFPLFMLTGRTVYNPNTKASSYHHKISDYKKHERMEFPLMSGFHHLSSVSRGISCNNEQSINSNDFTLKGFM